MTSDPGKVHEDHDVLVKQAATVSTDQAHDPNNPRVYLDVYIGGIQAGRIVIEVLCRCVDMSCLFKPSKSMTHSR